MAYKIMVVLDHIILKSLRRQGSVTHLLDELVVCVLVPSRLHVVPFKQILDKASTSNMSVDNASYLKGGTLLTEEMGELGESGND